MAGMKAFQANALERTREGTGKSYLEFLREGFFSGGLYFLKAGSEDPQVPHNEDEVYYVLSGRASFDCEGRTEAVSAGTILFVPARAVHRFHSVGEDLSVLVFFAPPETDVS
jgi:mannose-6-phosphate isomerase-like protein (cupin superfamily)